MKEHVSKMTSTVVDQTQSRHALSRDDERRLLGAQMAGLGVRLLNKYGRILRCERCEATWTPATRSDGGLLPGFWRCPNLLVNAPKQEDL